MIIESLAFNILAWKSKGGKVERTAKVLWLSLLKYFLAEVSSLPVGTYLHLEERVVCRGKMSVFRVD